MTSQGIRRTNRIPMSDYDYEFPEDLIAQTPLPDRAASRLLVLNRTTGQITHTAFREVGAFLNPGDLLVLNDSRVIPARLSVRRSTGGVGELLLLRRDSKTGEWIALGKPARRLRPGERVEVLPTEDDLLPAAFATIAKREEAGLVRVKLDETVESNLEAFGGVPLPPYITTALDDRERYQTVYARVEGSAAAPTAGLHFTPEVLGLIRDQGVGVASVTLHVGLDTFRPVTVDNAEDHRIHSELCSVPQETVDAIERCRNGGGRVIAIGTTSARTLETLGQAQCAGHRGPYMADTDIFITPGYTWTLVDGLLTNFHLPKSTLLLMVSALADRDRVMRAYREAIAERYRFFSFGDAMLIL